MIILFRDRETMSLEIIKVKHAGYDEALDTVKEKVDNRKYCERNIEGFYAWDEDENSYEIRNLSKLECDQLIEKLFNTGKLDLTMYEVIVE